MPLTAAEKKELEAKMLGHARNLEFEAAAEVRDEIHALKAQVLLENA